MSISTPIKRKRVAIVGAGSAGMSAAWALSLSPDEFEVTLFERSNYTGGMATSTEIEDPDKYGASYINDGVQGASPVFYNTFKLFEELGFGSSEVGMQCSFGKSEEDWWSNVFPSPVVDRFQSDIKRFGKVLKVIKTFEPVFALMSVQQMLSLFRFSKDFGEVIVFPLVALFFGTGNQTPFVSAAILERVFEDPSMRLFEYSPTSFLASIPEMRSFPRLSLLYSTWASVIETSGNVKIRTSHEVTAVKRTSKQVDLTFREVEKVDNGQQVVGPKEPQQESFDELIMCADADAVLKILGQDASWMEKKVLGNVKYLWDISVTHSDVDYMKKHYNLEYEKEMASTERDDDKEAQKAFNYAEKHFRPLYFIRSYPSDKKKIEMSFDLSIYQAQFKGESEYGPDGTGIPKASMYPSSTTAPSLPHKPTSSDTLAEAAQVREPSKTDPEGRKEPPLRKHVFQTIFLDKEDSEHLWSRGEIKKEEIVLEKWWKQQSHRWQHYGGTVPWMMFLNGKHRTHFAGAWTILNMHEIGIVSGFSAAYRLGARYPFTDDKDCKRLFALYLAASHGHRMRSEDRDGFFR